jgi:hypothetical protein
LFATGAGYGISPAGGVFEGDAGEHQKRRIQQHRKQREQREQPVIQAARHHRQRSCTARRVQATQGQHECNCHRHRELWRPQMHAAPARDSDQRRNGIARYKRPGLGHRAAWDSKDQHRAGAHGATSQA